VIWGHVEELCNTEAFRDRLLVLCWCDDEKLTMSGSFD
jgi:hypothetical protein